ncbi:putative capsid protein [Odonata-associated circular virus-8]|uniref:putative capsid protein n=1 Tax=Odonata-associated circular virus-8 TaxID=1592128 RepID=UPI0005860F8D|nr:putative capsid protein [Odonata-associated circular virus-8]AJD07472.1 putative capsid protein [Odonata-associated circular virus-8]
MSKAAGHLATTLAGLDQIIRSGKSMYNRFSNWRNPRQVTPTRSFPKFSTRMRTISRRSFTKSRSSNGTRKRSYNGKRKRNSTKRTVWRMKKKLKQIMVPAKSLWLDALQGRVTTGQGTSTWVSLGNLLTQNAVLTGFTGSVESGTYLMSGLANNDGTSGNILGRAKFIVHSWEQIFRWTNQSNCPLTLECYTLKCVQNVPVDGLINSGLEVTNTIKDFMTACYNKQYVGGSTIPSISVDHPAFKLSDLARFGAYFKTIRHKTVVVQPGESMSMRKYKIRPRTYAEAISYDAVTAVLKVHAQKGTLHYLWRITGTPQSAAEGKDATLCDVKMAFVSSIHARTSGYSSNNYQTFPSTTGLPVGLVIENIYPGTSEAKVAAPVP